MKTTDGRRSADTVVLPRTPYASTAASPHTFSARVLAAEARKRVTPALIRTRALHAQAPSSLEMAIRLIGTNRILI